MYFYRLTKYHTLFDGMKNFLNAYNSTAFFRKRGDAYRSNKSFSKMMKKGIHFCQSFC